MRRRGWWIAGLLILLTNLVILLGVSRNRSGEPEAVIELTERELPMAWRQEEDTGVSLRIAYEGGWFGGYSGRTQLAWLDRLKLEELGFDCSAPPNAEEAEFHYGKQLPRQGYVVLEYDGEAWRSWLASQRDELEKYELKAAQGTIETTKLEQQRKWVERERLTHTRLFPVDAGSTPEDLRERYPERDHFLIVPAVFRIGVRTWDAKRGGHASPRIQGYISRLLVQGLHVDRQAAEQLEPVYSDRLPWSSADPFEQPELFEPRYTVTLKVGRRHEPWVAGIRTP